jgi:type IV secretory pathway TrbD component
MTTLEFVTFTGSVAAIIGFGFAAWYRSDVGR